MALTAGAGDIREIDTGTPPTRFARGWHCLGLISDYDDGAPHSVEIFGTKLVVFQSSDGRLNVLDAHCRHMGGDLTQGTVKGNEIACPFHDWRWGGDGKCKGIPYAKRVPLRAKTRAWITNVQSGQVFVWHDHEGKPPQPEDAIPAIPEYETGEWTDWQWNCLVIEGSNCIEIVDNVVDMAHFYYIHYAFPTYFKNVFEGQKATQYLNTKGRPDHDPSGGKYGDTLLESEASYFGPAYMINPLKQMYGGFETEAILINCHYPVSADKFVLQYGIIVKKSDRFQGEAADAMAAIAGFCVCNDVSERAWQIERGGQWTKGKGCESFGPLGPWMVTKDEIKDPQNLNMELTVNGEVRQHGNTKTMIFGVAHLVWACSQYFILEPGDVIITGTPPGVGLGMKPEPKFLKAGDVVHLKMDKVGEQTQKVVKGKY